jgi:hypothetical protein
MLMKAVETGYGVVGKIFSRAGSIIFLTNHDRELVHGSVHELLFHAVTSSRWSRRPCPWSPGRLLLPRELTDS